MTDKELEKIYNEAYKAVYWTAMSLLKNEADAEDVVQDSFVTLIKSYHTIKDKSKVTPWLKKTAANKCLNRLTRTKTDAVEDEFFDNIEAVPEDFLPDSIVESDEMRKIIMDIIDNSLSEDIRRTLILFYFDDMSTKEIAENLGVPEGTVRRRLNFARNKIKKEVEKYEEDNDTKLFGMAVLPFLSKLFMKEAENVPFRPMPASLITDLSASAKVPVKGTGIKASAKAVKKEDVGTQTAEDTVDTGVVTSSDIGTEESAAATIDINTYDWESLYSWDGNTITGFADTVPYEVTSGGTIVIPAGCTEIGEYAFQERDWINEVVFEDPDSIESIGYGAFFCIRGLHVFAVPGSACTLSDTSDSDEFYYNPFSNSFIEIRTLVAPDGLTHVDFFRNFGDIQTQLDNQMMLENVYLPADFELYAPYWNTFEDRYHVFAKYTEDWFNNSGYFQLTGADYSRSQSAHTPRSLVMYM